ncbi:hypothetical protein BY996DRAFT_4374346 [Phakopsora pachyrhizi]|uniref:Uncharacterized protein n=1 Tax=Phakopsora pachyrhizi TaxID=170000 RepID=A0AAV0AI16_PHAPC|nr:hypothetical protein BY996DRAFT_4374346 [Phakopsora pachyrhizi]CAH7666430.1 hypothetical protein PPACK8108_LOCUS783 [Phakopsora pachyrhizi]
MSVIFSETSIAYASGLTVIQESCHNGEYEKVEQSTLTIHQQMTIITETVKSKDFNKDSAVQYEGTVASYIVDYSKVVQTVVDYPETEPCHSTLVEIHQKIQTVINTYASEYNISLKKEVDRQGGIDPKSLGKLNLKFDFHEARTHQENEVDEYQISEYKN